MSLLNASTSLLVKATATSSSLLLPLAVASSRRHFTQAIPVLFEKEHKPQAQHQNSAGSFDSFKQYRLKIVQKDPLSIQTRRQFLPHIQSADAADLPETLSEESAFKEKASKY